MTAKGPHGFRGPGHPGHSWTKKLKLGNGNNDYEDVATIHFMIIHYVG